MRMRNCLTTACAIGLYFGAASTRSLGQELNRGKLDSTPSTTPSTAPDPGRSGQSSIPEGQYQSSAPFYTASGMPVCRANKATGLIGMDVRDQQNEKVGDVKDVVMDFPSGRVGYVVLSRAGFIGTGESLMAVPPQELRISAAGDHLIINADRITLMNAPKFSYNNWPDPNSMANWNAYWNTDMSAVGGTSVGISTGHASSADTYVSPRLESRYVYDRAIASDHVFRGTIVAIDPAGRTMTVEGLDGTRTFAFSDRPVLTLKSSRNPSLIDFKVGYPVNVGYHQDAAGNYMADSLTRIDAP